MPKIGDTIYLPPIEINAVNDFKPPEFGGDGSIGNSRLGALISAAARAHILNTFPSRIQQDVKNQEKMLLARIQAMPEILDSSVSSILTQNPSGTDADNAAQIESYIVASNILIVQKTQAYNQQKTIADKYYYGRDFFSYHPNQLITNAISNGMVNMSPDVHYKKWLDSLEGAYTAKYINCEIDYLNKQNVWLKTELDAYKDATAFVSSVNADVLKKYGAYVDQVSRDLQSGISGKRVRSYAQALATFEKVNASPGLKLNTQDRQAVVNALNALDKATLANNVKRLGRAFGVTGTIVQVDTVREKAISGYQTGDWKPLMLEFEAMAVGKLAAAAAGAILASILALVSAPATFAIPAVAVLMALVSALVDADAAEKLNNFFAG